MSVAIREGYSVGEGDRKRVEELQKLAKTGILQLDQEQVQYCKCGERHKVEGVFLHEGRVNCSCSRNVSFSPKAVTKEYVIKQINYNRIIQFCDDLLSQAAGKSNCIFDDKQRSWICSYSGKKVPIFIAELSSYNQYITEESDLSWLCFVLDWMAFEGNLNYYNEVHFVRIEDLLVNKVSLPERLDTITTKYDSNVSIEIGESFDTFVSSITWQRFEKFAEQFLNGIKLKVGTLEKFTNSLTVRKNTIYNSKIIRLGGPANPDFVVLELNKYLQEALRPDKAGEVKHYIENKLNIQKYSTNILHAGTSDTLCIVASNNIDPEIWKFVLETEKQQSYFKHTILERDTIVLLIRVLGLKELISTTQK